MMARPRMSCKMPTCVPTSTWASLLGGQNFLHGSLALPCMRRWPEPIAANVMTRSRGLSAVQGETMKFASAAPSPEQEVATAQSHAILEEAILSLPDSYRTVLMMRDIEELTTAEAAESLDITEQNVKVRLHRARALLRRELYARAGASHADAFAFMGVRCDRVVKNVFARLAMIQVAVDPGSSSIH